MASEQWKNIIGGFESYQVSSHGRIRNKDKQMLITQVNRYGFHEVKLKDKEGRTARLFVHPIVAQAFVHNPDNRKNVVHKDGNKANNNASNLQFVDRVPRQKVSLSIKIEKKHLERSRVHIK